MIRRVAAAILAVDEFTGTPITGNQVCVRGSDGTVPVRKDDGYHVFWDNGERERRFLIEVPGFYPETVTVDTLEIQRKRLPAESIYLIPAEDYPFPAGVTLREVMVPPLTSVILPWTGSEQVITFRGCENDKIILGVPFGLHMRDRLLFLINRKTDQMELCAIREDGGGNGVYLLKTPLRESWNREDTAVSLAYRAAADNRGKCFLPDMTAGRAAARCGEKER